MTIKEIIHTIEAVAPLALQEDYDNSGVQVGDVSQSVDSALLCIDITEEVIDEAIRKGISLIISHHPLLFKGLKSLTGKDYIERCVMKAVCHNICLYSAHTNLDSSVRGVNKKIAEILDIRNREILSPQHDALLKLVTYVPNKYVEIVRSSLFAAGAGHIGNYDACSYNSEGFGTFRAGEKAQPFVGKHGELHHEPEMRVEVILPKYKLNDVLDALLTTHPYEEPAYDLIPIANDWQFAGSGMIGDLKEPMDEMTFLHRLKSDFQCGSINYSNLRGKKVSRVAFCGGSGAFLIPQAIRSGADAFVTGEIKYHDYFANEGRILLASIGHYESEQYTTEVIASIIRNKFPAFEIEYSKVNTNPINYL